MVARCSAQLPHGDLDLLARLGEATTSHQHFRFDNARARQRAAQRSFVPGRHLFSACNLGFGFRQPALRQQRPGPTHCGI